MRSRLAPWLVFLVTVSCAAAVAWYVDATSNLRERLRYETSAATVALEVGSRLDTYLALLGATQAFMASSDTVTAEMFTDYVGRLALRERFPGLQGLGFSVRLPGAAERHAIVYLEPRDARNRAALGYDMYAEPVRREAMARARDAARPAASGRVRLLQEITPAKQQGFLVYLPVYTGGGVPATVEERRRRLLGFVYSPFRVGDLLAYAVEPGLLDDVSFRVYDGAAPSAEGLLYASDPGREGGGPALQRRLEVAGRAWTLVFRPRRPGGPLAPGDGPLVLLAGVLVGVMLAGTTHSLVRARERAERSAAELRASEAALRLTEERFRSLVEQSPFSIQIVEPGGRTIAVNHSWERLWGATLDQLGGYSILEDPQLEAQGTLPLVREAFAGAARALPVTRYVPDRGEHAGRPIWVRATIYPVKDGDGRVREVIVVHEDITEQRRTQEALAKERELLAIILDNTESGIVACDAEGRLTRFNRKTRELVGRGEAPILPEQWAEHYGLHAADGTRPLRVDELPLVRALRGERVRDVEMTIMPGGAPPRSVLANAEPMLAPDGSLVGAVCVMFDITQRKRTDEALRRAQKLESVGVLAGGIAH